MVDLDGTGAARVAGEIGGLAVQADVSLSEAWPGIVEEVTARFGGIDLAHLNAGVTTGEADITALTDALYRRALGVNVDGVTFGIRALVPAIAGRAAGPSSPPPPWPVSSATRPTRSMRSPSRRWLG